MFTRNWRLVIIGTIRRASILLDNSDNRLLIVRNESAFRYPSLYISATRRPSVVTMSEKELSSLLHQLHETLTTHDYEESTSLLSRAKLALLSLNALVPSPQLPQPTLLLARETLELGALVSIRRQDPASFTRYFQQLQPFYDLPASQLSKEGSNESKVTGLHLLLLLSQGDYAGFHTVLESLEVAAQSDGGKGLEGDEFVQYPVKLEQWLMEGAYDRVWGVTKSEKVPSEEYAVFSDVSILLRTHYAP